MYLQQATTEDIPEIYRLASKIWNIHYMPIIGQEQVDYMLSRMYSREGLTAQMMERGHLFYLIFWENKSIGFFSISGVEHLFIHKFYIDQDVQNRGLGTLVFEEIKKQNPQAQSYELTVNRKNYKSINFYFKLGFTIDHVDDFDIGNGYWMNDFIMKWNKK